MAPPGTFDGIRLFLRLVIGIVLISSGSGKLLHPPRFRTAIRDYQVLPPTVVSNQTILTSLSIAIPIAEVVCGLGLVSGLWLVLSTMLAWMLLAVFSAALISNLRRGRYDLSCHCGGALGNHRISWWLVGRNAALLVSLVFLLVTRRDVFTLEILMTPSPSIAEAVWVGTALPVALIAGMVLLTLGLFSAVRPSWHDSV